LRPVFGRYGQKSSLFEGHSTTTRDGLNFLKKV
jgi:hypothetical protein